MRPYSVRQVVAADNEHGRTIMWQMTNGKEDSLEYRKAGSNDIRSVKAVSKELKETKVSVTASSIPQGWTTWKRGPIMNTVPARGMKSANGIRLLLITAASSRPS